MLSRGRELNGMCEKVTIVVMSKCWYLHCLQCKCLPSRFEADGSEASRFEVAGRGASRFEACRAVKRADLRLLAVKQADLRLAGQ